MSDTSVSTPYTIDNVALETIRHTMTKHKQISDNTDLEPRKIIEYILYNLILKNIIQIINHFFCWWHKYLSMRWTTSILLQVQKPFLWTRVMISLKNHSVRKKFYSKRPNVIGLFCKMFQSQCTMPSHTHNLPPQTTRTAVCSGLIWIEKNVTPMIAIKYTDDLMKNFVLTRFEKKQLCSSRHEIVLLWWRLRRLERCPDGHINGLKINRKKNVLRSCCDVSFFSNPKL